MNKGNDESGTRRLLIPYAICSSLMFVLVTTLGYRQLLQKEEFTERERKQATRRILRPGPRGDVLDRQGKLLIGNMAHFSAVIRLENLRDEISRKKIDLIRSSRRLKTKLADELPQEAGQALSIAFRSGLPPERAVILSGKPASATRVKLFVQGKRIHVEQTKSSWRAEVLTTNPNKPIGFNLENNLGPVKVAFAGICEISLPIADRSSPLDSIRIDGIKLDWEARFSVVSKYLNEINQICGRRERLSMGTLKRHYQRRLILPMRLAGSLEPEEYAALIEKLPVDSPIKILSEAVRHYPAGSTASHVLGYVGSGYEADSNAIPGIDLATFALEGRTGKSGIEKQFDSILRGKDGGDIWRVDPIGYRFQRSQAKPPRKGQSLRLSLDVELQQAAEKALSDMTDRVAQHRSRPDLDWQKAILSKTRSAMRKAGEKEEGAELLLQAFREASPYPLGSAEAATVAGFDGTRKDAERLLKTLYSRGVLEKSVDSDQKYAIAPTPKPPGAAVLMKVDTGEILALASKPDYDLNDFSPKITTDAWQSATRRGALLPRALNPGYPPASTYKLVTAIAALRHERIIPDEKATCEGIYKQMECHVYPGVHGEMNLVDAIAQSCNIYFFKAAEKIETEKLIEESKFFGMHEKVRVEMPSLPDRPIVPDPDWKKRRIGEDWKLEDTFNMSIGQGGLVQSPLRMATFAASLARNQSRTTPTLLYRSPEDSAAKHDSKPIGLDSSQFEAVIKGMAKSASVGTARRCKVNGVKVAGKTGTGQWRNNNMQLSLAWFIGFAPLEKPEVAIAILIEGVVPQDNIQGGITATPVAQKILQAYFDKKKAGLASLP